MVSERGDTMSEQEANRIFGKNLRKYMERNNENQLELSQLLNVSQSTISYWLSGGRTPRFGVIDKLCSHYGITRSELLEDGTGKSYYTDETTQQIAQEIFESKEMRGLFYAAKDLSPEKLRLLQQLCKQLKDS